MLLPVRTPRHQTPERESDDEPVGGLDWNILPKNFVSMAIHNAPFARFPTLVSLFAELFPAEIAARW